MVTVPVAPCLNNVTQFSSTNITETAVNGAFLNSFQSWIWRVSATSVGLTENNLQFVSIKEHRPVLQCGFGLFSEIVDVFDMTV